MGVNRPNCLPTMDDVLPSINGADFDLMMDPSSESILLENFDTDNLFYDEIYDFNLLNGDYLPDELSSDNKQQLEEDPRLSPFSIVNYDFNEDLPVNLDQIIPLFNQDPCKISVPRSKILQKGTHQDKNSLLSSMTLELAPSGLQATNGPSTPDVINTVLHLETSVEQQPLVESNAALTTVNLEALYESRHASLLHPITGSSDFSAFEQSPSRPGTSCSSDPPTSPTSLSETELCRKRTRPDSDSATTEYKKLKNNEASRRSRLKRKERVQNQSEKIEQLEVENRKLTRRVIELELLRDEIKQWVFQTIPTAGAIG